LGERQMARLTSPYRTYQDSFRPLQNGPRYLRGFGLRVRLNQRHALTLMLDTGASGIAISPKAAEKAGLETLGGESTEARGIGDDKAMQSFRYVAKEIAVGDLTLADFPVSVFRGAQSPDFDGLIGSDVFSKFLVTADFPRLRLTLTPFPDVHDDDADGPYDAPDQLPAGFHRAARFGNHLAILTSVNQLPGRLFLIDSGSTSNLIDTDFARESGKVDREERIVVKGIQGRVKNVSRATDVTLVFANFRQSNQAMIAFSLDGLGDGMGAGIAGVLGMPVLENLAMTLDYRNGAVHFEYKR
jgi:hypothetical protein